MTPLYIPNWISEPGLKRLLDEVPWVRLTETRSECFMSPVPYSYTYGKNRGARTYTSVPFAAGVEQVMATLNTWFAANGHPDWSVNGVFLNKYEHDRQHLGWHADDFDGMDHSKPVVSVSFGEPREIWWREFGTNGEVPAANRQMLAHESMFIMPPGMQHTHQHRIPKGDRPMGPRVSLTFRSFLGL